VETGEVAMGPGRGTIEIVIKIKETGTGKETGPRMITTVHLRTWPDNNS